MEPKQKKPWLKYFIMLLLALMLLTSVISVGLYAVRNINYSQYEERVQNSNILMEKICNNIETAVDFNWQSIHYISNQLSNETFSSMAEMLLFVGNCEDTVKEGENTKILLISDQGFCYVTDGTSFKWMSPSLLNEQTDVMYVSDHQFASKTGVQMHYLSRFAEPFTVEGITFTHASLVCDMKELDSFFDVSNYGEESITFIIHKDGSQVYRQDKQTKLSGIYNLLSALKDADFGYGVSYSDFQNDIVNTANDSVYLTLDDNGYFMSYYHLGIKDWVVVLMVPEAYVGTGTQTFAREIIASIALLFGVFFVVLLAVFGISAYQINRKHRQVNEQLVKAAEAERAANAAKTNFLSSMSHDIRTPMNAIVGMVAIASKRLDDTAYIKECLDKVSLASGHLLTLINDILDISKVESGQMKLNQENFSLTDCFSNLLNIMQPQAKEKHQNFHTQLHELQHDHLYGDKLRINQIFINLLSNAIKYTEEYGDVWVDLYEEPVEASPNMVRIKYIVRDNGMGMSKEYQETMYQAFTRASDSRTSKIQGSGLGLAICKQMVELMNGSIHCESELGLGTTFTVIIDLPVAEGSAETLSQPEEESSFGELAGTKLLIAEDNDLNWEIAYTLLQMYGIDADRAENGKICTEMMNQADEGYYDLILMDVRMPIMDGREATRMIRRSEKEWIRSIPVVAMTADAFAEDVHECMEAGMNEHIAKPLDMERLLHVLQKYCSR